MKESVAGCLLVLLTALSPLAAQRARRAAPRPRSQPEAEDSSSVSVTRSASLRVSIDADAVTIFNYLSDAQKLMQWFPEQAILDPQLGGKYHFRWGDNNLVWSGVITEFIRGNTLGLTWKPPDEDNETSLRFKLSPQGAQTLVELMHSGFSSSEALDKAVRAWTFYLGNLKSVVEDGSDMRAEMARKASRATTSTPRTTPSSRKR